MSLDPTDWSSRRALGRRMLDDMFDHIEGLRERPVWRPIPAGARDAFDEPLPAGPTELAALHEVFLTLVAPYGGGNAHPGFMGWVQGGGSDVGMLAEMLAAGLNANLGGRDHMPIEVERQIVRWMRDLFALPASAEGLFVTGASMATQIAVQTARTAALGEGSRRSGLGEAGARLVGYASSAVHGCAPQAFDAVGLGSDRLRRLPAGEDHRLDLPMLEQAIDRDRREGLTPFMVIGSAGTVDIGAFDDLDGLADIAAREGLWLHVDGALGGLGILSPLIAPRLAGIERADSIAFDFHKLGQAPYDAGFLLARDGERLRRAFAASNAYLRRETRGMAGGDWWPCDYGPDLSRGFRALKVWFTLKHFGAEALGEVISGACALAQALEAKVAAEPELELLAPAAFNIVCFRYRSSDPDIDADALTAQIVIRLQEAGEVAPSLTTVGGRSAIRAAIVNHRTELRDVETLVRAAVALGRIVIQEQTA